jgi:CBS domain-containing protein
MIARDVMTADPLTVTPEASAAEVWDLMREVDVRFRSPWMVPSSACSVIAISPGSTSPAC